MVVHVCNPNTLGSEAGGLQIWSQPSNEILQHNKDAFTLWDISQNGQYGHRNWTCWQSQRQQLVQICLVTEQGLALALKQISGFHKMKSRVENAIIRFPWQSQPGDRLRCSLAAGIGARTAFPERSSPCHATASERWPCSCLLLTPGQVSQAMSLIL